MTKTFEEIVNANRGALIETMMTADRDAMESRGNMATAIYIWSDGEIETLCMAAGSNSFLRAKSGEDRVLYDICERSAQGFDPFYFDSDSACDQLAAYDPERFAVAKAEYEATLDEDDDYEEWELVDRIKETDLYEDYRDDVIDSIIRETDYDAILDMAIERYEDDERRRKAYED